MEVPGPDHDGLVGEPRRPVQGAELCTRPLALGKDGRGGAAGVPPEALLPLGPVGGQRGGRPVPTGRAGRGDRDEGVPCDEVHSQAFASLASRSSPKRPSWTLSLVMMVAWVQRASAAPRGAKLPPLKKRGEKAWDLASSVPLKYNNRLVIHAVDDNTNVQYERAVKEFLLEVKRVGHPFQHHGGSRQSARRLYR